MRVLTERGLDDDVYKALQQLAKTNHRSLQEQVKVILEREIQLLQDSHVQRAQALRKRLASRAWGDTVADIRSERER
jgi:plasmid stability protein